MTFLAWAWLVIAGGTIIVSLYGKIEADARDAGTAILLTFICAIVAAVFCYLTALALKATGLV